MYENELKETDSSQNYNRILKMRLGFEDGEGCTPDGQFFCCCQTHKGSWSMEIHRSVKKHYRNNQRNWKKFRKTQYKTVNL